MTADRWQQIKALFLSALEREEATRADFISAQCGDDAELRSQVENLLANLSATHTSAGSPAADDHQTSTLNGLAAADLLQLLVPTLTTGTILGERYQIERELGRGGVSVVYLAQDLQLLSRRVVVKVLQDQRHKDPYIRQKFQQEMEALARIEHPGVVGVLDAGLTAEGHQFIAMQFIEGTTLRDVIEPGGMEHQRAAGILRQIGQALSAAHDKGIWHRDLKPENVMIQNLGGQDHVKLIDFGIAAIQNSQFSGVRSLVMGSLRYMAPEQHLGHATATSDIYSFGVLAHEVLTGNTPGAGMGRNLPLEVTNSIARAMSYDPAGRQQSPRIFGDELAQGLLGGDPAPAPVLEPRSAPVPIPIARRWPAYAGIAGILAIGLAVYAGFPQRAPLPKSNLQYHVMVQKYRDGQPFELPFRLSGERIFESGYQVQIVMSSPVDGYLYVLNEGPKSTPQNPDLNTMRPAMLKANVEMRTPFLRFDDERGIEKMWLVWSKEAIPQLEALRKWETGAIEDSGEAGAVLALVKKFAVAKVEAKRDDVNRITKLSGFGEVLAYMISLDHE